MHPYVNTRHVEEIWTRLAQVSDMYVSKELCVLFCTVIFHCFLVFLTTAFPRIEEVHRPRSGSNTIFSHISGMSGYYCAGFVNVPLWSQYSLTKVAFLEGIHVPYWPAWQSFNQRFQMCSCTTLLPQKIQE